MADVQRYPIVDKALKVISILFKMIYIRILFTNVIEKKLSKVKSLQGHAYAYHLTIAKEVCRLI